MRYEFTNAIPYDELEKELRGFSRMLMTEGYSHVTNLVISFDGNRQGDPPRSSADFAGVDCVIVECRLAPIRWPRPK